MKTLTIKFNSVCNTCRIPKLEHPTSFPVLKDTELYPAERISAKLIDVDTIQGMTSPLTITSQCKECGGMNAIRIHWALDEDGNFWINRIKSEV